MIPNIFEHHFVKITSENLINISSYIYTTKQQNLKSVLLEI